MPDTQRHNVMAKRKQIARTDTTATKLFTLPPGSFPVAVHCYTAATATSATLSVGTSGDATKYVNAGSVQTAQVNELTLASGAEETVPTDVYGLIGGSPAAGGPFDVVMFYINKKSARVL